MDDLPTPKHRLLTLLNSLKEASKVLHTTTNPFSFHSRTDSRAAIDTLLDLEAKAHATLSSVDPTLRNLSRMLSSLRTLIDKLHKHHGYSPRSLLHRYVTAYKISHLARAVESQIQSYIDRLNIRDLVDTLQDQQQQQQQQVKVLVEFRQRLSQGFDLEFQDLVLRAKVFTLLECMLFENSSSERVKEEAAMTIAALVKFNKNVFVGLVLMGPTIKALIAMASGCSVRVLSSLIRFIRSPLVDEILCSGEIPKIVGFLRSRDLGLRVAALDCVLELGYIGRREVVEAMLKIGLVEILMDLQREEGCCESDCDFAFECCVSRFAIQVEVGEGLSGEEKREVKSEILRIVKEASKSEAEFATVSAEILWGSSP
ncbi:hypothetical protein AAZX31_04G063800 [Glycine max]|uniref:Uncharacterized protein n=2 Tax=Glycine subgen. Soja TaxID=1462606 RepID=K7KIH7_SOYBN|nr:hypothetical protein JHK85_009502 [Glycine max]KAG5065518.1 hypothetical protein JHK86_009249 [Glycine max]KAH1110110.1 hypothetical protein GYH30_009142 [Glycine max]KHN08150.1 hypothetical protein glysoja_032334 [Glycine soja]KRH61743.1 hypothetical protein GLYMA_04G065400v4 [Glycine max]